VASICAQRLLDFLDVVLDGTLDQMVDIIIDEQVPLFVSAVGVPPKWVVEKLHANGIVCANMVGAPHHVTKALDLGIDLIIAQGTEAGGHTGDIATSVLIPQCVDLCKGRTNFFHRPVTVVAAGGIYDGRGLAASLMWGASGVWVGTRFIACEEAGSSPGHRKRVLAAKSIDTTRTIAFTGRPCRVMKTPYVKSWMERPEEVKALTEQGVIPFARDVQEDRAMPSEFFPALMGQAAGAITSINTAAEIVESMMDEAMQSLNTAVALRSKL
jgi:NAD(P)H-dependent flavin oxidoreductase YrpB (nitropropane dioxygenase family)